MTSMRRSGGLPSSRLSIDSRRARGSVGAAVIRDAQHRLATVVTRRPGLQLPGALPMTGYTAGHIAVRIQRGGGEWPYETPATSRKGTVPIPSGSNNKKPGRCGQGGFSDLRPRTPAEVFSYAARVASLQRVPNGIRARRTVCVLEVLRSARGRLLIA